MAAKQARALILRDCEAANNLQVQGYLNLSNEKNLVRLPNNLTVTRLNVSGCAALRSLPAGLRCWELDARNSGLVMLAPDLRVENRLDLSGCTALTTLPQNLSVGTLVLAGCTHLCALPEGLEAFFLDVSGCAGLTGWPARATVRLGRLVAQNCANLRALPAWLTQVAQLDLSGCENIASLPDGLRVTSWLDIAGTRITALPASLAGVRLRWRGVLVDERAVFSPESISGPEVLRAPNAEVRRVLLERMGYERFLTEVDARLLDKDADPGGERRLLRVPLPGDEDLVCLAVFCPSTRRQYVLRVPPTTRDCHQAAAWIAGFDDPAAYRPLAET